jgi:hypothetical protein
MRKLLFIATLASALIAVALAVPASATPTSATPSSAARSSAARAIAARATATRATAVSGELLSGSGTLGQFGDPTVVAHALAAKGETDGGFVITYPDGTYVGGSPVCLRVSGNTAYLTGRIILSYGPRVHVDNWSAGNYVVIGVQDNGKSSAAQPDLLNFSPGYATNPGCGPSTAATPVFGIIKGDYRVFHLP